MKNLPQNVFAFLVLVLALFLIMTLQRPHSVCDSQPFANGIVITAPRESYHPNAAGHAWLGGVLASSGLIPL